VLIRIAFSTYNSDKFHFDGEDLKKRIMAAWSKYSRDVLLADHSSMCGRLSWTFCAIDSTGQAFWRL
jgi:hypothetical protein